MSRSEREQLVLDAYFDRARPRLGRLAGRLVDDAEAVVDLARARFVAMLPELPYVDRPQHPLAPALFICAVNLALYLVLRERGVEVHQFGGALLTGVARAPLPPAPAVDPAQREAWFTEAGAASQVAAEPGEDVFHFVPGDGATFEWGYDVTSCAICGLAARHAADEVVPYMCAVDDVMSDRSSLGLRRTGSIALGADHCDFRYQPGEPRRLGEQYRDRIRLPVLDG